MNNHHLIFFDSEKGAPRLEFLAGRPNATAPAIDGLIPEPQDPVTMILDRFADAVGFDSVHS